MGPVFSDLFEECCSVTIASLSLTLTLNIENVIQVEDIVSLLLVPVVLNVLLYIVCVFQNVNVARDPPWISAFSKI